MVFLLGLSGLLGALTQARNATGQARRYMQATDIANDLLEQIQLWPATDTRLTPTTAGVCKDDPLDKVGALSQPKGSAAYSAYAACLRSDADLKASGRSWAGLTNPTFMDELGSQGTPTQYERYYMILSKEVRENVQWLQIWVKVRYEDPDGVRVVTVQGMRVVM
ncbi:hypothetical protein BON30_02645 [Cystobacter ferrugineus]|uniref:PilX/PilW C-terminal domain-containing protein n=1 Tax=Cystobacter ferrugineus TaxID=83449 RepID=A0A1L9BIK2_9BACT|nr:hypothetical protein BON30_02645 [Cystobacter ferrugineus]